MRVCVYVQLFDASRPHKETKVGNIFEGPGYIWGKNSCTHVAGNKRHASCVSSDVRSEHFRFDGATMRHSREIRAQKEADWIG